MNRHFEGVLDGYFEQHLADYPEAAALAGLPEGEGKLSRPGPAFLARDENRRRRTLRALEAQSPTLLTREQRLDQLALSGKLRRESEDYARGRHAMDPAALEHVLNMVFHELMRGTREAERGRANLRALLRAAPSYLAEAGETLDEVEEVWANALNDVRAGVAPLMKAVETFLSQDPKGRDGELIEGTKRACADYYELAQGKKRAPKNSFAIGASSLQRRIRDELGLDYSLGEIEAVAAAEIGRVEELLETACKGFGGGRTPSEILEKARNDWDAPEDLVGYYRTETTRIAGGFRDAGVVAFPKGDCLDIVPCPEFMRSLLPTAAYSAPGPFERPQRGVFWVNDLSVIKRTEKEKRAERAQHFGVALTCAHEGYPGHHLQFVTANGHPRKWRPMFSHAIFYEGWTLWCEQMLIDLKLESSPIARAQQLFDALWRCHRILVDLRLQSGRYNYDQAVRHLVKHLQFTKARARADVNWYTGQPGVPMSYWLGRLENERLRRRLVERQGWSLRKFNDWLLSFGTLPQGWIEKYGLE